MTVKYGFYDSLNGDRVYNANDISTMFEGLFSDGVFEFVGNGLEVVNDPGTMNILVKDGRAWFNNLWIRNTSTLRLPLTPSDMIFDRIDLVVLEFDFGITVRENSIKILTGIPAAIPIAPILSNTLTCKQYALASIYVSALSSEIVIGDITNRIGTLETPYATSLISAPIPTIPNVRELLTSDRTYYVRTDGSDSNDGLTDNTSGAFLTVAKVNSVIATIDKNGYNIKVKFGAGIWNEAPILNEGIGDGTVTWEGTLTLVETAVSATVTAGSSATHGTVTKTGQFTGDNHKGKLAYFVTDASYRVIDSNTNDILTLVGPAPSNTTQNVEIYTWGSILNYVQIYGRNTILRSMYFNENGNFYSLRAWGNSSFWAYQCRFDYVFRMDGANAIDIQNCYFYNATNTGLLSISGTSAITLRWCLIWENHTGSLSNIFGGCSALLVGNVFDGDDGAGGKATWGLLVNSNSFVTFVGVPANGFNKFRNCDVGLATLNGGKVTGQANNVYSGNTVNESIETFNGWNAVAWSSPTRTSNYVFTVAEDVTGIIEPGTKLKFTDTTVKYGTVYSVVYGSGVSTITLITNSDYVLIGNPSAIYWSNIRSPFGFPEAWSYTATYGGTASMTYTGVTTTYLKANIDGRKITVWFDLVGTTGGTASYAITLTLPCNAVAPAGSLIYSTAYTNDGGAGVGYCRININANPGKIEVLKSTEANWSLGATKYVRGSITFMF